MLKAPMKSNVISILEDSGYTAESYSGCFDIVAKKNKLLIIKILQNIDAMHPENSNNLKIISENLGAHLIIVAFRTNIDKLKKGVVYERLGIPAISFETFRDLIQRGIFPSIYRGRGGLFVEVDKDLIREARSKRNMTQRELAEAVGISKKAIYEHEKQQLKMMLSIADRLEKVLNKKVKKDARIFEHSITAEKSVPKDKLEKAVGTQLRRIGFDTNYVKSSPFDIIAKEKSLVISDVESNRKRLERRALPLKRFISVVKQPAVMITEKLKYGIFEGIPVIKKDELKELGSSKELIKIAKESK